MAIDNAAKAVEDEWNIELKNNLLNRINELKNLDASILVGIGNMDFTDEEQELLLKLANCVEELDKEYYGDIESMEKSELLWMCDLNWEIDFNEILERSQTLIQTLDPEEEYELFDFLEAKINFIYRIIISRTINQVNTNQVVTNILAVK